MNKQPRKCLKCGNTFDSTGVGNRICPKCAVVNRKVPTVARNRSKDHTPRRGGTQGNK